MPPGVRIFGFQRAGQHLHTLQKQLLDALSLLLDLTLQVLLIESILQYQRALLQRTRHSRLQLPQRDGFQQEVGGAEMQAVDRRGCLTDATQHDHGAVGEALPNLLQKSHPVQLGHSHVRDDERNFAGLVEDLQTLSAGARF